MPIYEVNLPNQIVAILNEINPDFETQFKELENLVDYIESGKCPWIDDIWLSKLKRLQNVMIVFWKIKTIDKTDPDLPRVREITKRVTKILKKYS